MEKNVALMERNQGDSEALDEMFSERRAFSSSERIEKHIVGFLWTKRFWKYFWLIVINHPWAEKKGQEIVILPVGQLRRGIFWSPAIFFLSSWEDFKAYCQFPQNRGQGPIFWSENDIYFSPPPPLLKMMFFPLLWHAILWLLSCPICLNSSLFCTDFTLFFTPYFLLFFPLFPFSFPFFHFVLHFHPICLPLFIFFTPNDIRWYSPPPPRGIFQ